MNEAETPRLRAKATLAAILFTAATATAGCSAGAEPLPESAVSGTLTVGGKTVELSHAVFDGFMLAMMSEPGDLESAFQIGSNAVILALDVEQGGFSDSLPSYIQHESFSTNNGQILDREGLTLELESFSERSVVGRASMKPVEIGYDYGLASFDVTFDVTRPDPCKHLGPLEFTGNLTKPARAVEELFTAISVCDWERAKAAMTGDVLEDWKPIEADPDALDLFVEFFITDMPRNVEIVDVVPEGGDRALVTVRFGDTEPVEMRVQRVDRKWRVAESEIIKMDL